MSTKGLSTSSTFLEAGCLGFALYVHLDALRLKRHFFIFNCILNIWK